MAASPISATSHEVEGGAGDQRAAGKCGRREHGQGRREELGQRKACDVQEEADSAGMNERVLKQFPPIRAGGAR